MFLCFVSKIAIFFFIPHFRQNFGLIRSQVRVYNGNFRGKAAHKGSLKISGDFRVTKTFLVLKKRVLLLEGGGMQNFGFILSCSSL